MGILSQYGLPSYHICFRLSMKICVYFQDFSWFFCILYEIAGHCPLEQRPFFVDNADMSVFFACVSLPFPAIGGMIEEN